MTRALLNLEKVSPTLLVILAVISINLGPVFAIKLFSGFGTLETLFLRMAPAAILLCIAYRGQLVASIRQSPSGVLILGIVMVILSAAFYESLQRIPLGIAVAIEFCGPLAVSLFASRKLIDLICVSFAALGIFLLTPQIGESLDLHGVLYAAVAGAGWAAVILISKRLGKTLAGGTGVALGIAVCAIILFPVYGISAIPKVLENPSTLALIAGVAVFSAAIPYLFEYLALKTMPAKQFGILVAMEPVVAAIVGVVVLTQIMDVTLWLSITLISLAALLISLTTKAEPPT
jgi:inner membrane transporter RhtA